MVVSDRKVSEAWKRPSWQHVLGPAVLMVFVYVFFNRWDIVSDPLHKLTVSTSLMYQNLNITENNPVILFHQRKTGGSSLRRVLFKAAQELNVSYFIPCYGSVPCDTYSFKGNRSAIYAGHFPIQEVRHLLRHVPMHDDFSSIQKHNFTCLSSFRDPVARVESCFYFRFMS